MKRLAGLRQSSLSLGAAAALGALGLSSVLNDGGRWSGWVLILVAVLWVVIATRERRREDAERAGAPSRLVLRGVERGIVDGAPPSPALERVIDEGYVTADDAHVYVLTSSGRDALHRPERRR